MLNAISRFFITKAAALPKIHKRRSTGRERLPSKVTFERRISSSIVSIEVMVLHVTRFKRENGCAKLPRKAMLKHNIDWRFHCLSVSLRFKMNGKRSDGIAKRLIKDMRRPNAAWGCPTVMVRVFPRIMHWQTNGF